MKNGSVYAAIEITRSVAWGEDEEEDMRAVTTPFRSLGGLDGGGARGEKDKGLRDRVEGLGVWVRVRVWVRMMQGRWRRERDVAIFFFFQIHGLQLLVSV